MFIRLLSVVAFSLRAKAAHDVKYRNNQGIETYFQTTYSDGFIGISQDLTTLARSLLVASTLGDEMRARYELASKSKKKKKTVSKSDQNRPKPAARLPENGSDTPSSPGKQGDWGAVEDHPRTRFWVRQFTGISAILFWATVIMSTIAGVDYQQVVKSGAHAALVRSLW